MAFNFLRLFTDLITFKRILKLSNLGFLGSFAWLMGILGASITQEYVLLTPRQVSEFLPTVSPPRDRSRLFRDFESSLKYNIFNVKIDEQKPTGNNQFDTIKVGARMKNLLKQLTLNGTYLDNRNGNFAFIYDTLSRQEGLFNVNDTIFETGAIVIKIKNQQVWLKHGSEVGILASDPKLLDQSISDTPSINQTNQARGKNLAYGSSIQKESDTEYILQSEEVQAALKDINKIAMQARVQPHFESGQSVGFLIKAIEKGSIFAKLGLQNYDVIKRVNGEEINSLPKALSLLKTLRNEKEVALEIERKKKPITLSYTIN